MNANQRAIVDDNNRTLRTLAFDRSGSATITIESVRIICDTITNQIEIHRYAARRADLMAAVARTNRMAVAMLADRL